MSTVSGVALTPGTLPHSRSLLSHNTLGFAIGVAFGFLLVGAGVHRYDVIRDALLLRDPYVFLLMGAAVATAAPFLWLLRRRQWVTPLGGPLDIPREPVRRANLAGSAVFGAGWAVTGSCPGPALASVAAGNLIGAWVVGGLFSGIWLYEAFAARHAQATDVAGPCTTAPVAPAAPGLDPGALGALGP